MNGNHAPHRPQTALLELKKALDAQDATLASLWIWPPSSPGLSVDPSALEQLDALTEPPSAAPTPIPLGIRA